jgi:hypothetical protein
MRASTRNHRDNLGVLVEQFGAAVWAPIHLRTVWELAMEYGQTVYSFAPGGNEFQDAWGLVGRALKGLGEIPADTDLVQYAIEETKDVQHAEA